LTKRLKTAFLEIWKPRWASVGMSKSKKETVDPQYAGSTVDVAGNW
jgi:hypothetical protein